RRAHVHGVSERLLNGGDLGADPVEHGRPQNVHRQLHPLGEDAVPGYADDPLVRANELVAGEAHRALSAEDMRLGPYDLSHVEAAAALDLGAYLDDPAEQLVAHHEIRALVGLEVLEDRLAERL